MPGDHTHFGALSLPGNPPTDSEAQLMQSSFEMTGQKPLSERIDDFRATLGMLREVRPDHSIVINLDLPDPTDNAMNFFRQQEFIESPHTPHRLYLNQSIGFIAVNETLSEVSFAPRKHRAARFSSHGLFMADLHVETEKGDVLDIPVAVKPHEDEAGEANDTCLREYVNTLAVAQMGIHTLQPVGIINGMERAYSLTRLEEDITTLDSIDWSNFYPNMEDNPGMLNIWSQVARQAAMLHSIGNNMHGDMAARNIATTIDDAVFFIDWEMANISKQKPHGSTTSWAFAHSDIDRLVASMCMPPDPKYGGGIGIFTSKDGDWNAAFEKIFFNEYSSYRMGFAEANQSESATKKELEDLAESSKLTMDYFRNIQTK
ncbi:MAG TPA: hypothetical protein VJC09_02565 [Candidatus Saccharimonadales bacterium]|nr:hypothetical protein [Candidatus Saccharimonadales bacterium]